MKNHSLITFVAASALFTFAARAETYSNGPEAARESLKSFKVADGLEVSLFASANATQYHRHGH